MRKLLVLFLVIMICSCKDQNPPVENYIFKPDYLSWPCSTVVNVNGADIIKYYKVSNFSNGTKLRINMTHMDDNGYYYDLGMYVPFFKSGTYVFDRDQTSDVLCYINSLKSCCEANPDELCCGYKIAERDSLKNFIRIHIDSLTQNISGMFKATLVIDDMDSSSTEPRTLRVRCDTFNCKYAVQ